jgi:hypothetical protein
LDRYGLPLASRPAATTRKVPAAVGRSRQHCGIQTTGSSRDLPWPKQNHFIAPA